MGELMTAYDAGRAAWKDGAPCPRDPEERQGWLDAREEYHQAVQVLNRNTDDEGYWWNILAMKEDARWEVVKA